MNVTIVMPPIPYKFEKTPYAPLGVGYIAAAIRQKCSFVERFDFIDGQILQISTFWQKIETAITDVLLISASIRQMKSSAQIASIVKRNNPHVIVILGGPGPSGFSIQPQTDNFDVIVKGEAEELLPVLLEKIDRHEEFVMSDQLAHTSREGDAIVFSVRKLPDVNAIPCPDRSIFDIAEYEARWRNSANMNSVSLIGSRGCPFHCIFCDHSVTGYGVRYRSVANIAAEMMTLQGTYKPDDIFFYDDLFTTKPSRVNALCKLLHGANITWSAQGRVDCITEPMLEDMLGAGCMETMFGGETGSNRLLEYFHKGFSREQIISAFRLCHKMGMKAGLYLIIGVPGETKQDILQTVSLIEEIEPSLINISYLTPFPATELYTLTQQWIKSVDFDLWDDFQTSVYNYAFELDPREAEQMILAAYERKIAQGMSYSSYQFANAKKPNKGESNERNQNS